MMCRLSRARLDERRSAGVRRFQGEGERGRVQDVLGTQPPEVTAAPRRQPAHAGVLQELQHGLLQGHSVVRALALRAHDCEGRSEDTIV